MSAPARIIDVTAEPVATPVMVRVTAPSTLPEGYTFDAVYSGEVFQVTVPRGGVKAGQTFDVPFLPTAEAVAIGEPLESPSHNYYGHNPSSPAESTPMLSAHNGTPTRGNSSSGGDTTRPLGTWRTDLFDCLSEGICHPSLWNAMCCPQILMGQVLTRMKLGWCGNPVGRAYKRTTCTWIFLTLLFMFLRSRYKDCLADDPTSNSVWRGTLDGVMETLDDDDDVDLKHLRQHIKDLESKHPGIHNRHSNCTSDDLETLQTIQSIWFWTTVIVLAKLRHAVRKAHGIADSCCCEDLICAAYCGCCTVAQLARQTANYREQRAYFFTDTGLASGWFGHRQEELERRHEHGHHLVHAHSLDQHDEHGRHVV